MEGGYRKFLSEEPHVGDPVVDLAQHALQILTGYPKHIHTFIEKKIDSHVEKQVQRRRREYAENNYSYTAISKCYFETDAPKKHI